ncbi:MAG TPA: ABC transporter ATP-binding protein, partial [Bacteroidetes bacterium]|nr:ABC transporter ATP-binding protein [Bacteroidota bacterium]
MPVVEVNKLIKEYPAKNFSKEKITALKNFSLNIEPGSIFGLLGPNGAGKTTLVKILLGITFPTSGEVKIFDKPISDITYKYKVGYLPENHRFPNYLSGEQVLSYYGRLSGLSVKDVNQKIPEMLSMVGMSDWGKTKIKKYSKGMMQRLGLAQSMLNNPELIFLDEPTDGVDPIGRKEIRDILLNLKNSGKTIFLNSHLLSEIELVCDKVAILDKGSLVKTGTIEEITAVEDSYVFFTSELSDSMINDLIIKFKVVMHGKNEFTYASSSLDDVNKILDYLRSGNILIKGFNKEKTSLEDMFINIIGKQ